MTNPEIYECIQVWLWCYDNPPHKKSDDSKVIQFPSARSRRWEIEMLTDIAELGVPKELFDKSIVDALNSAIGYGLSADPTNMKKIHDQLLIVMKYMVENKLYVVNPK
jgi:hypothetical protein